MIKAGQFNLFDDDSLVGVEDFFVNVGPKLFQHEVGSVDDVAGKPFLANLGSGAVFGWVVEGGCAGCST